MQRICVASLAAVLLGACSSSSAPPGARTCTVVPPAPPDWRLVADGTRLRDGLGRLVFLRGVDAGGRSKFAPYVPFDYAPGQYATALAAYMDRAASWGVDAMRVPFTWAALEPTQGMDDADWLSRYDQLLDAAWARGIYTVVDFHQDVYSEVFCGDGFPGWTVPNAPAPHHDCGAAWGAEYVNDPDVRAAFDRFWAPGSSVMTSYVAAWDVMVARYKDKPGVLGFEPINEPGWGTADEATFEATTLTDFFSTMAGHMRAAAPASLVFFDPPGLDAFAAMTTMNRPSGDGIVFAPHFYPLGTDVTKVQPGLQSWADVGTMWNVPVFVGEFGVSHDLSTGEAFMAAHLAAFDALGLSGTEWEYSVEQEEWNSESASIVAADGTEYPIAQAEIRPFARAVDGEGVTQSFDATTHAYALAYTPGKGVTEVSLPARAYPSGYDLTLTGACVDATSVKGRLLLEPDTGVKAVVLKVTKKK